ncbi:ovochymase-1 [Limosa lapponica baueri]|uniref:Ovochymase-1 n=1 Tax=Limosa lapponica baueri TaxID=1758121 RepID=A0A2I0TZE7_LIMLA|nr:ovochymase-1 [Limosa lapponica baueri]
MMWLLRLLTVWSTWNRDKVQPICLPHRDEDFQSGTVCVASGCGKVSEAPEDKIILVRSIKLDVDYQIGCDRDSVSLYLNGRQLTSLGCGSVAMLVEEGKIDTANYPGLCPRNTKCHWLIEAPAEYVIKRSNKPLHWTVTVGDHDRVLRESTEQVRQVKAIMMHPDFDMLSYESSIALMQLGVLLEYNAAVRPGGSGGPLVCHKDNGPFILCGVFSQAVGCASPKKPGDLFKGEDFPGLDKTSNESLDKSDCKMLKLVIKAKCSDRTVMGKKYLSNVKDDNPMLVKVVLTGYGFGGFPFRNDLALLVLQKPLEPDNLIYQREVAAAAARVAKRDRFSYSVTLLKRKQSGIWCDGSSIPSELGNYLLPKWLKHYSLPLHHVIQEKEQQNRELFTPFAGRGTEMLKKEA